jgi:hypothetical protein
MVGAAAAARGALELEILQRLVALAGIDDRLQVGELPDESNPGTGPGQESLGSMLRAVDKSVTAPRPHGIFNHTRGDRERFQPCSIVSMVCTSQCITSPPPAPAVD